MRIIQHIKKYCPTQALPYDVTLEDLAPIDNADNKNNYCRILSWALNNPNIKNIALTGPYGSGKSSVLKTFEKTFFRTKLLYVSLATFNTQEELSDEEVSNIEKSILQQIFYRVAQDQLPNSRFKRISNIGSHRYFLEASFLALTLISVLYFYAPDLKLFRFLISNSELIKQHSLYLKFIFICTILSGVVLYLKDFLQWIGKYSFWKINIKNAEIEVDQKHDSILNRYLDELLYFFERTNFRAVVIEDLDRFNQLDSVKLFTKLREINTIINNYEKINQKVTFIYAIKDDVFTGSNRTKFFDFLIPIIPVINRSNSREKFIEKITKISLKDEISSAFLADITLYIEDMRLLKNIFNEFAIYKGEIFNENEEQLSLEKLLAIIVYKNKYPQDFVNLHSNEGMIAEAFKSKDRIVKLIVKRIESEILNLENQIIAAQSETKDDAEKIREEYVSCCFKEIPNIAAIDIDGTPIDFASMIKEENFQHFIQMDPINYYIRSSQTSRTSSISYSDLENMVNPNVTFLDRISFLEDENHVQLGLLIEEKLSLEHKKASVVTNNLKTLLDTYKDENYFIGDIENEDFLKRLLRKGYIDESYDSYISHFYEGSLTREDRDFLLRVKGQGNPDFQKKLTNINQIISDLEISDFGLTSILNIDLLDFLLSSYKHKSQLDEFVTQLCIRGNPADDFIGSFWISSSKYPLLIKEICLNWDGYSDYVLQSHMLDHQEYLKQLVLVLDLNSIKTQNSNNSLTKYISQMTDFFEFAKEFKDIGKLKETLNQLNIKLVKISEPEKNIEIFDFIYTNNLYEINVGNLESILTFKNKSFILQDSFYHQNLTIILNSNCNELISYINDNHNSYFINIHNKLPNNFYEHDSALTLLLNSPTLSSNHKTALLLKTESKVENIQNVNNKKLWGELFKANVILASWQNIIAYFIFKDEEVDDILTKFLNIEENYKSLQQIIMSFESVNANKALGRLYEQIFLSHELLLDSFEALIKSYNVTYSKFDELVDQTPDRVAILIKNNKLSLSKEIFDLLKTNFSAIYGLLIEYKFKDYMKSFNEYPLDAIGVNYLLKSEKLNLNNKIRLINRHPISFLEANPDVARNFINNFKKSNDAKLVSFTHVPILIKNARSISVQIMFFMSQKDKLDYSTGKLWLSNFLPKISGILNKQKPTIPSSEENILFVKRLQDLGLISSSMTVPNGIRIFSKKLR